MGLNNHIQKKNENNISFTVNTLDFLSMLKRAQLPYLLYKSGSYTSSTDNESAVFLVSDNFLYTHVEPSKKLIMFSRIPIHHVTGSGGIFAIYLPEAVSGKVDEGVIIGLLTLLETTGELKIIVDKTNMQLIVKQREKSKRLITLNMMHTDEIFKRENISSEQDFIDSVHRRFTRTARVSEYGVADFISGETQEIGRVTMEASLVKSMLKVLQVLKCVSVPLKFTMSGELVVNYERQMMGDKTHQPKRNKMQEGHPTDWTGKPFNIRLDIDVLSQFQIIPDSTFMMHVFRFNVAEQDRDVDTLILIGENTTVMFFLPLIED